MVETMRAPPAASVGEQRPGGEMPAVWRACRPSATSLRGIAFGDGVSTVQAMPPPIGLPPERWRRVQQDAARLLAEHGDELHRAGWSAADVFGVYPASPGVAVRCAGLAVVLGGARLIEVTAEHAVLVRPSGARLTYVRRPAPEAVPLWDLEA